MLDIHCHILPGVDDGSESMGETKQMFAAAAEAGITSAIATPHYRSRDNGTEEEIEEAYRNAKHIAAEAGICLYKGAEVNHRALADGAGEWLRVLTLAGTNCVLVEFSSGSLPMLWENRIYDIQGQGFDVIIAHPERYAPVQQDISIARRMIEIGCELQLSADFIGESMFSKRKKTAAEMLKKGLVSYIASDAHCVGDYDCYTAAMKKYGSMLRGGILDSIR